MPKEITLTDIEKSCPNETTTLFQNKVYLKGDTNDKTRDSDNSPS